MYLCCCCLVAISRCYPSSRAHCRAVYMLPGWRIRELPTYFSIQKVVDTIVGIVLANLPLLELDLEGAWSLELQNLTLGLVAQQG